MRDLPTRVARGTLRLVAVAWLWVAAPLELAAALSALLAGHAALGATGGGLVAVRLAVVALGLVLGRDLVQRAAPMRLATAWAAADLGTLAVVLATRLLPSSRAPGDAPLVWGVYAVAAAVVIAAVRWTGAAADDREASA